MPIEFLVIVPLVLKRVKLGGGVLRGAKSRPRQNLIGIGNTHSKLRVNGLVGDIVGNVLDLRIVFTLSGRHVGSSRASSSRC
jgi:hypothetical protein